MAPIRLHWYVKWLEIQNLKVMIWRVFFYNSQKRTNSRKKKLVWFHAFFLFSVTWNVRGTIIRDGDNDKYEVTPEGLVIKDVSQEDKGAYKCKAIQLDEDITDFQDMIIDLRVQRKF